MNRSALRLVLACSLLLNLGVVLSVAWHLASTGRVPALLRAEVGVDLLQQLALTPDQRRRWDAAEGTFLADLEADRSALQARRERLVRLIFSEQPDRAAIEAEREAIAASQQKQQRRVIDQLLVERDILDLKQRETLADLLLQQPAGIGGAEQLHRK